MDKQMDWIAYFILFLQLVLVGIILLFANYFKEKGKNQATKEDITEITGLVKRVETKFQIEIDRHSLRNELLLKAAELFYELDVVEGELIEEHGLVKVQTGSLSYEEKRRMCDLLTQVNTIFAKLYLTMPDETYKTVIEAVPDSVGALKDLRAAALVSLRQAQFPDSMYLDTKYLRSYWYGESAAGTDSA